LPVRFHLFFVNEFSNAAVMFDLVVDFPSFAAEIVILIGVGF